MDRSQSAPGSREANLAIATVYVIDDEEAVRRALDSLLRSAGVKVETYASSRDFLERARATDPSCLILDVRLRGENGLDFQIEMAGHGLHMPVIFVTAHGDIAMTVRAMKAGAADFLAKPYHEQDVLDAVSHAIEKDVARLSAEQSATTVREAYESLTPREREVVGHVLAGLLNKQIAFEMNVSEVTVKMHRGQAMRKMCATSVADLVMKVRSLGVAPSGKAH
jgi:FixJ family two-component response regulator